MPDQVTEQQVTPGYMILDTEPKTIEAGMQLVSYTRKNTDKNPVKDSEKFRCVVVPSYSLPAAMDGEKQAADVFQVAIAEAFMDAASEILLSYVLSNKDAKQIPAERLTFAAIVEKMQAAQTSQRINQEQIAAWYDKSKTAEVQNKAYGDTEEGKKKQALLRSKFLSLASNNPSINPTQAVKMLSYIHADDTAVSIVAILAKKLERLSKTDLADDL